MPNTAFSAAPPPGSTGTIRVVLAERPVVTQRSPRVLSAADRVVFVEVAAAIVLVGGLIALARQGDLCVPGADIHPLWIPVLVFAARYGVRGMFISVAMAAAALAGVSLVEHGTLVDLTARGASPYDIIALMSATLVAWTAMIRDGRLARNAKERDVIAQRLDNSEETASALREVIGVLRDRLDRIDLSITMWRAIAARLARGPLTDAAAAALELAAIRTGAASGLIQRTVSGRLQNFATFGHSAGISDISRDRTILHAVNNRRTALRGRVPGATQQDSEIAVPILDSESGAVLGVIAMRETPPGRLRAAEVHDLEVITSWLAEAFPRAQARSWDGAC